MQFTTILGYAAALFSTASFAPQAWKIIRSRQTRDISLGMYTLTVTAFAAWLGFGILRREWPLVLSNSICLCLAGFILLMKLLPQSGKRKVAETLTKPAKSNRDHSLGNHTIAIHRDRGHHQIVAAGRVSMPSRQSLTSDIPVIPAPCAPPCGHAKASAIAQPIHT